MLFLSGFGVCFGQQVVLAEINLELPRTGIDVLMGPVKTGKSTLFRSLAGLNERNPNFHQWGTALLDGLPLTEGNRPALVQQHASLYRSTVSEAIVSYLRQLESRPPAEWLTFARELIAEFHLADAFGNDLNKSVLDLPIFQQRQIMVVAAAACRPKLLLIDEPTYGLESTEGLRFAEWLRLVGERQRIMVTLHHLGQARRLADRVALLAGGRILAHCNKDQFFVHPTNAWVEQFIRTGSLSVPSPGATAAELANDIEPPPPLPQAALHVLAKIRDTQTKDQKTASTADDLTTAHGASTASSPLDRTSYPTAPSPDRAPSTTTPENPSTAPTPDTDTASGKTQKIESNVVRIQNKSSTEEIFRSDSSNNFPSSGDNNNSRVGNIVPDNPTKPSKRLPRLPSLSIHGVEDAASVGLFMALEHRGPTGFKWIVPGRLAGCPEPGAINPLEYDLDLLNRIGITYLVTLTDNDLDQFALRQAGIKNIHLPIRDREAPTIHQAYMLVHRIQRLLDQGEVVAVHCKAGIGRTGTVLAAWMIREGGLSAATALERLRRINPAFVQSEAQEKFLTEFENDILKRLEN